MQYYWEIIRRDEPPIYIPPDKVDLVKKWWKEGKPIETTNAVIPHHQILDFRMSTRPYNAQPQLAETIARAFDSPVVSEDGTRIHSKWVKKLVPGRMWAKHYSQLPSYHSLGEEGGLVRIAFKLPVHLINPMEMEDCTEDEINRLTSDK